MKMSKATEMPMLSAFCLPTGVKQSSALHECGAVDTSSIELTRVMFTAVATRGYASAWHCQCTNLRATSGPHVENVSSPTQGISYKKRPCCFWEFDEEQPCKQVHAHKFAQIFTPAHAHTHTYTHTRTHQHAHTHTPARTSTHVHTNTHTLALVQWPLSRRVVMCT